MSATNDRTRHDADVADRLAAWQAVAAVEQADEPEHVERYLREMAAALVTFERIAGVPLVGRDHADPLWAAVRDLLLDACRRGLHQGRHEQPRVFLGFLRRILGGATFEQRQLLTSLIEESVLPPADDLPDV